MAVTLTSTACPAVVVPASPVYLGDTGTNPPTAQSFSAGLDASGTSSKLNYNSKIDNMGSRYGSGGYGIGSGFALSASTGLTVAVANGQAVIDGVAEAYSHADVVVTASGTNWLWIKTDGSIVVQFNTTAKPSGNCVLLGAAITDGSSVTSIDTSGVVYFKGGDMWRQTADAGMPADTPDSSLWFYTKTTVGLWLWDGSAYRRIDPRARASVVFGSDANYTATAGEYAQELLDVTSSGSLTATRDLIVPATVQGYDVRNNTTGGQSIRVKTSGGAGITIASAKAARVWCDGTNVVRLTSDA